MEGSLKLVTKRQGLRNLLGLILLCVIMRLAFLLYWPENYALLPVDVDGYWDIAGNLMDGKGFATGPGPRATASRPPMYPVFLAGVYWLTGGQEKIALASQAALDAATCAGIYFLAVTVTGSIATASLACFFWAVYLPEASQATRFWSEPLGALFLTYALLLFVLARTRNGFWLYGLAGLVFGGTALTRPALLFLPLLFATLLLIKGGEGFGRRALCAGLLLLGLSLPLAPWALRNALVFRAFVPMTTHGGLALFHGNSALDSSAYMADVPLSEALRKLRSRVGEPAWSQAQRSEVELDLLAASEARRLIGEHPVQFAKLSLVRFSRLWFSLGFGRPPSWRSLGVAGINFLLLVLGIIAWTAARRTWSADATPLGLALLYGTLVHLPIIGLGRYVFPLIPALVVLSAVGFMHSFRRRAYA